MIFSATTLVSGSARSISPRLLNEFTFVTADNLVEKAGHRWTSTGILQWVRTFTVSLPSAIAEMPWRPCEAITIRSQPFDPAVSIIAW